MTLDFHTEAVQKKKEEFEKYYSELLLAHVHRKRYYHASFGMNGEMSREFARELAEDLQQRSGFICKVRKGFMLRRHVLCKFIPCPKDLQTSDNQIHSQ